MISGALSDQLLDLVASLSTSMSLSLFFLLSISLYLSISISFFDYLLLFVSFTCSRAHFFFPFVAKDRYPRKRIDLASTNFHELKTLLERISMIVFISFFFFFHRRKKKNFKRNCNFRF